MTAKETLRVILGIETSCDDTAAAIIVEGALKSSVISSQFIHRKYGGVVPELASRAHQRLIVPVVTEALREGGVSKQDITAVAVTYGPGLAGSLLVGLSFAKALSLALDVPLVGVNHLDGHVYSVFLEDPQPAFPFLCLTVSGGHTQIARIDAPFRHEILGRTRDDASGEAFDKVAKLLGLGYPGGPKIDKLARSGDPNFHRFPRTRLGGYDFSFSGLKTSVLYYLNSFSEEERAELLDNHMADICASFQAAVVDVLVEAIVKAAADTGISQVAITGGVSANSSLRAAAIEAGKHQGFEVFIPPLRHCMDNAAMIAMAGYLKLKAGQTSPLTLTAVPAIPD